jgi:glycosyltransferase involved in cell wall biosynthesis
MKIAFVNQPIDTILPPYQTSVGACTYGMAGSLARYCDVIVYGAKDRNERVEGNMNRKNLQFRFFPLTASDRLMHKVRELSSKFHAISPPASTASGFYPSFGRQVALDLQKERCDVIHIQHCSQYVPVICALNPAAKVVLHLHAEWFSQNNPAMLAGRLRKLDLLTTVSDYVTEKTRRAIPEFADRCETTYNGIDHREFSREKDYAGPGRRVIKKIMYAGAVSPHKGVHVLLEAFKRVVAHYPDVHLEIVGFQGTYPLEETFDVQDREMMKSMSPFYAKNHRLRLKARLSLAPRDAGTYLSCLRARISPDIAGKVTFPGMIPRRDLIDKYYDADIFAFPAIWNEGFGIPPVEAMAAGVPVVATPSGALVETVRDGQTGILVGKNDPDAVARALLRLLENDGLREGMGRAARKRALDWFSWDKAADTVYRRYTALCELGSARERPVSTRP